MQPALTSPPRAESFPQADGDTQEREENPVPAEASMRETQQDHSSESEARRYLGAPEQYLGGTSVFTNDG